MWVLFLVVFVMLKLVCVMCWLCSCCLVCMLFSVVCVNISWCVVKWLGCLVVILVCEWKKVV